MRADPDLPLSIAASVNSTRRAQVRSAMTQAGWRLRKQNPSLVIDEYVDKVERFAPRSATDAELMRHYQTLLGRGAIQRLQTQAHTTYVGKPSAAPVAAAPEAQGPYPPVDRGPSRGERNRRRGGKAMGLGLLYFAGGAVVLSIGTSAGLFMMTAGFFMVAVGLITFLVGAAQG